jgi:hypothetical protein
MVQEAGKSNIKGLYLVRAFLQLGPRKKDK